jgi:eukaryotic-like serine/threonine-protein kinase
MKTCPVCDTPFPDQHLTCPTDGAVLIETRELEPGHIVRGKYRIIRKLGQGGMGIVYLAEHSLLGGQVALKFLATELSRNPQFVKRFRNEARAAYQLRHPNIVEVTDLDQDEDGTLFIAMEFIAGPSLRTVLRENKGPLPVPRALQITRDVAAGLAAAHARGAIHRDIKPENILLKVEPDGRVQAKVLDFGIAVMTDNLTNLSRTHGLLLTPEYAAPEQWRGTPGTELDGRTDLYALGGLLYEMLTGRTPFRAVNPEGWMFQHLQGVPEPLSTLRPDIARDYPHVDEVVMRLLAREREQRFSSATALLETLTPGSPVPVASAARPVITSPAVVAEEAPVPARPVAFTDRPTPAPPPAPAAPTEPPPRRSSIPKLLVWAALIIVVGLGIWLGARFLLSTPATAVPILLPAGGTYSEPQLVAISDATSGAIIHYTVDGSPPSESSTVYAKPLEALPSGTVVRAMATAEGHTPSPDITGVYIWSGPTNTPVKPPEGGAQGSSPAAQESATQQSPYDQGKSAYDHKQYAQARTLFAQACESGELRACNYLGYLYAQGLGGTRDAEKARSIYQNACDQGNLSSCASLGSLYQDAGNNTEARKYFKKACDGKLAEGCALLRGAQ